MTNANHETAAPCLELRLDLRLNQRRAEAASARNHQAQDCSNLGQQLEQLETELERQNRSWNALQAQLSALDDELRVCMPGEWTDNFEAVTAKDASPVPAPFGLKA